MHEVFDLEGVLAGWIGTAKRSGATFSCLVATRTSTQIAW